MRDGQSLAEQLRAVANLPDEAAQKSAIRACIDPYIQIVDPKEKDRFTGLRLMDIWRYFRYTWSTAYNNTPGRKIFVLIRDRAAADHPIIGIAALGSAIVQMSERDRWIGWQSDTFLESLRANPTAEWACWLHRSLDELIAGVYRDDLLADELVTQEEIDSPTQEAINRLRTAAKEARRVHRLYAHVGKHKASSPPAGEVNNAHWRHQAKTYLFRSKRAATLADLLEARRRLVSAGFDAPTREALARILERPQGRRAVQTVLRHVRAAHVGVDMLDITVCGAVAPYNAILGGKLVSLLMASPEIVAEYTRRYRGACSVIASSMAGRAVRREPRLVLLCTTSLYGVASSQYNRLRIPADAIGATAPVRFERLGRTAGFGSYHFSRETMSELEVVVAQGRRGREVNSIFGEGVNPKLRKVRSALDAVGLPSDALLQHGSPRIIYGLPLASNFREVLLGIAKRPQYLIPQTPPERGTRAVVDFWTTRWLLPRIKKADVLDAVGAHTLAYPVTHGARVRVPIQKDEGGR